ncbi:MAG: ORF6N domain-containing protein [Ferruginibacter sp.]|nr:ORF6N domain-containing protein [Ferruginibacter sp.]
MNARKEYLELVANCDRFQTLKHSTFPPFAFTEYGAVMLASVLNSERAIQANIQIVRVFTALREIALLNKDMIRKVEKLEQKIGMHDKEISVIFETLKKMLTPPPPPKRNRIGFIREDD